MRVARQAGVRPSRGKKVIDTVISLRLFVWITRQPVLGLDKILWHRQVSRVNPQQPFIQSQYEEHLTYILLPAGRDLLEIYIFYKSIEIYTESIWRGKKWAEKTLEELLSISSSAQWFSKGCHLITCSLLSLRKTRLQGIGLSPDPPYLATVDVTSPIHQRWGQCQVGVIREPSGGCNDVRGTSSSPGISAQQNTPLTSQETR